MSGPSRTPDLDDWDPFEPMSEPAIGAVPPRKPPTAVGAGMYSDGDDGPSSSRGQGEGIFIGGIVWALDQPVRDVELPTATIRVLVRAGVSTVGRLLVTDDRLRHLGVDAESRERVADWRRDHGVQP